MELVVVDGGVVMVELGGGDVTRLVVDGGSLVVWGTVDV